MKEIFIGRPLYWLLWVVVIAVMWAMGENQLHTVGYRAFIAILFALAVGSVLVIVLTYRTGERITRDPLDED